jgi:hypothetical protein
MSTLEVKELSHPAGQVIKIASGKTLDLNSQGTLVLPTVPHAKMPSGSVLQVVSVEDPDHTTMTNTSYVDVGGLTASITPSNASSKILVRITPITYISYNADSYPITYVNIVRGSTVLKEKISYYYAARAPNGYIEMGTNFNMEILDSPNTTSTVTYKVQSRTSSTVNSIWRVGSTITLTEIQA